MEGSVKPWAGGYGDSVWVFDIGNFLLQDR